jgi:NurA-like 5'-3' nuclease
MNPKECRYWYRAAFDTTEFKSPLLTSNYALISSRVVEENLQVVLVVFKIIINTILKVFLVPSVTNRQCTMMTSLEYGKVICCLVGDRSWIPVTEEHSFSASASRLTAAYPFSYAIRPHFSPYTRTVLPILQKLLHTTSHMGNLELHLTTNFNPKAMSPLCEQFLIFFLFCFVVWFLV